MRILRRPCVLLTTLMLLTPMIPFVSNASPIDSRQSNEQTGQEQPGNTLIQYVPGKEPSREKLVSAPLPDPTYEYTTEEFGDSGIRIATPGTTPIEQDKRQWSSGQNPLLAHLSVELMGLLNTFGENLAGVSFSSNDQYLEVYVVSPQGAGVPEIINLAKSHGLANHVVIMPVKRSLKDLAVAANSVDSASGGTLSAAPDFISNGLRVTHVEPFINLQPRSLIPYKADQSQESSPFLPNVIRAVGDTPLIVEPYSPAERTGRYDDYSPFYLGGTIVHKASGGGCTLGVPLVVNDTGVALTAGHCGSGSYTTLRRARAGEMYTTTYPEKAASYGDWMLLKEHYQPWIWNGPARSSSDSAIRIVGAVWGTLPVGHALCFSGQTTGENCNFRVKQSMLPSIYLSGPVEVGYISSLTVESNGQASTNGWRNGDSGGPVYYMDDEGNAIVVGIATASSGDKFTYFYTRLEGVRQWAPNARLG